MNNKLITVEFGKLSLTECAFKYNDIFKNHKPLLKYNDKLIPFDQNEIPFAYLCNKTQQYVMFKNFVHLLQQNFESIYDKDIEVKLCKKPQDIEIEVARYLLNLMQIQRAPTSSAEALVDILGLCGPRCLKTKRSFKLSRCSVASISHVSENMARAALNKLGGDHHAK